ncbi:hypothetical protein CYMTET_50459 [Cymbomonas tetramitiformis]|uniref:Uncharacterized protein n=1 Tax=Cymbomonas tetramitiformis TaxID=36881 RepID=A0AAE0BP77_9CHLO|nr:hypothetical protein CYMTET_50459 [Cymbomonas tetramitiformis]
MRARKLPQEKEALAAQLKSEVASREAAVVVSETANDALKEARVGQMAFVELLRAELGREREARKVVDRSLADEHKRHVAAAAVLRVPCPPTPPPAPQHHVPPAFLWRAPYGPGVPPQEVEVERGAAIEGMEQEAQACCSAQRALSDALAAHEEAATACARAHADDLRQQQHAVAVEMSRVESCVFERAQQHAQVLELERQQHEQAAEQWKNALKQELAAERRSVEERLEAAMVEHGAQLEEMHAARYAELHGLDEATLRQTQATLKSVEHELRQSQFTVEAAREESQAAVHAVQLEAQMAVQAAREESQAAMQAAQVESRAVVETARKENQAAVRVAEQQAAAMREAEQQAAAAREQSVQSQHKAEAEVVAKQEALTHALLALDDAAALHCRAMSEAEEVARQQTDEVLAARHLCVACCMRMWAGTAGPLSSAAGDTRARNTLLLR